MATSRSRSTIRRFARSASCHRANGDPRTTKPTSTLRTGCIANCRRIHRSRCAAPATIRAWISPESAHLPSKSARATSRTCRWRCANMFSAPPRSTRTCCRRAFRRMTGSPRTRESSAQSRGHRCRRGRSRAARRRGRGERIRTAGTGIRCTAGAHRDLRGAACRRMSADFPSDSAARRPRAGRTSRTTRRACTAPPPPLPTTRWIDGGGPQAAPSSFGGKAGKPVPSVAIATYDPRTGRYVGPDGKLYQQSDLATSTAPKTWQDMLPT